MSALTQRNALLMIAIWYSKKDLKKKRERERERERNTRERIWYLIITKQSELARECKLINIVEE